MARKFNLEWWEKKRKIGKTKYIIFWGIIGFPLMCLLGSIIGRLISRLIKNELVFSDLFKQESLITFAVQLAIYVLFGWFFGHQSWIANEAKYQDEIGNENINHS